MAETRTFNVAGQLTKLVVDNRDRRLFLQLEDLSRSIPNSVASIVYEELDVQGAVTKTIAKTRTQLLGMTGTYSYVYTFTYYPGGEINVVRIRTYDASAKKLDDVSLKHFTGGEQPRAL